MSENKTIAIIVAAGCGIALIVIVGFVLSKNAKAAAREQKIATLATRLGESVSKTTEYIRDRDFERATSALQQIQPSIVTIGDYSLKVQYDQAMSNVASAERDYKAKVKAGWVVFEGKFISPDEKQRIVADRKRKQEEETRRAEQERKLAEAHQQRQTDERQRREERQSGEQQREPRHEVVADERQDTPGKSQVLLKVVIHEKPSNSALRALLQSLFDEAKQQGGFKFRQHPNAVYIYAYGPNTALENAVWIGMASYNENTGDSGPEIRLCSESRLESTFEEPTVKAGLSERQRRQVFWESVSIEDQAMAALERALLAGKKGEGRAEADRITASGERELRRKYGLTEEELQKIQIEGATKGWPMP